MSNIYIQEPPTNGKVLLKTSAGEIEIELWAKEAPKTCRNFVSIKTILLPVVIFELIFN
jgi:peptidyl-prolyl cis-trans isomerase SDCCAG10